VIDEVSLKLQKAFAVGVQMDSESCKYSWSQFHGIFLDLFEEIPQPKDPSCFYLGHGHRQKRNREMLGSLTSAKALFNFHTWGTQ